MKSLVLLVVFVVCFTGTILAQDVEGNMVVVTQWKRNRILMDR